MHTENITCLRQINKNIIENNVKKNKKVYEILTILHINNIALIILVITSKPHYKCQLFSFI